jgi:hypothetical protein
VGLTIKHRFLSYSAPFSGSSKHPSDQSHPLSRGKWSVFFPAFAEWGRFSIIIFSFFGGFASAILANATKF